MNRPRLGGGLGARCVLQIGLGAVVRRCLLSGKLGGVPVWLSEYWEARRVLTSASCSQARQRCSQFVSLLQHDISCEATVSQTLTRKAKHRLEGLMAKPTGLHFAEATLPGFGARSGRPPGRRHGPVPGSVHTHAKLTKKGPDKGILF